MNKVMVSVSKQSLVLQRRSTVRSGDLGACSQRSFRLARREDWRPDIQVRGFALLTPTPLTSPERALSSTRSGLALGRQFASASRRSFKRFTSCKLAVTLVDIRLQGFQRLK